MESLAAARKSVVKQVKTIPNEHPELILGAAFLGGLIMATIFKRLGRR